MIFNIQRYSTHDGTGIRTNIFFKGCPLRCLWCSNPESQFSYPEIMYDERICKKLGECLIPGQKAIFAEGEKITIHRDQISDAAQWNDRCPSKALQVVGKSMTVDDLLHEIEKDIPFYEDNHGGVTLTGGEPLAQGAFVRSLAKRIKKESINISLETSLYASWEIIEGLMPFIDEFLIDLKHIDKQKFQSYTGGNLERVIDNLRKLDQKTISMIIRIPVIPGFNQTFEEMKKIIDFVATLQHVEEIHFIPYHTLGEAKYKMLGRAYPFTEKGKIINEEINNYQEYSRNKGFKTITGG